MNTHTSALAFLALTLIFILMPIASLLADDNCARTALINYQQVLIDTGPNEKGEGLRFYLEKDETAKKYLEVYQENTKLNFKKAIPGTLGLGLLIAGAISTDAQLKTTFLATGGATLILTIFISRFMEESNEDNLLKAIEEYNKRNMPQIEYPHSLSPAVTSLGPLPFFFQITKSF